MKKLDGADGVCDPQPECAYVCVCVCPPTCAHQCAQARTRAYTCVAPHMCTRTRMCVLGSLTCNRCACCAGTSVRVCDPNAHMSAHVRTCVVPHIRSHTCTRLRVLLCARVCGPHMYVRCAANAHGALQITPEYGPQPRICTRICCPNNPNMRSRAQITLIFCWNLFQKNN